MLEIGHYPILEHIGPWIPLQGLINLGREPVVIERGMRIAQMLIAPVPRVTWEEIDELPATSRGAGGFGHTGR